VLIVTHAADPYRLTSDTLMDVFASPVTLAGWDAISPASTVWNQFSEGMPGTDIVARGARVVSPADTWSR
jgi:hypothetical protein